MTNVGAFPIDPSTPVGNFRLLAGDAIGTPIPPVPPATVPTEAIYKFWSDQDILAFLEFAGENTASAIAQGYSVLIANAKIVNIRTDDLNVKDDTVNAWEVLLKYWGAQAEAFGGSYADFFPSNNRNAIPEGVLARYGESAHWDTYYRS